MARIKTMTTLGDVTEFIEGNPILDYMAQRGSHYMAEERKKYKNIKVMVSNGKGFHENVSSNKSDEIEIKFAEGVLDNSYFTKGLEKILPYYINQQPKNVVEMTEEDQAQFKKLSALDANLDNAGREVNGLKNKKNKTSPRIQSIATPVLFVAVFADFIINIKDSLLYKSAEMIGGENGLASIAVGSCVVAVSALLLGWGTGKIVSNLAYNQRINTAQKAKEKYVDEFVENSDAFVSLKSSNREIEKQHRENQMLVERKERALTVEKLFHLAPRD